LEVEEYFSKGQKGSSAMPHKRNPVLSENLTGLARLVRGYAIPALENVVLWHERDISHSSVERIMAPDANIAIDFSLARMTNIISNLIVYPENMKKNLNKLKGLPMSEGLMLALTQKGLAREKAYKMIQKNAMVVWQTQEEFIDVLLKDNELKKYLSTNEIKKILNLDHALRRTNQIFKKVFK
jgi:adenylosuccinate lyase